MLACLVLPAVFAAVLPAQARHHGRRLRARRRHRHGGAHRRQVLARTLGQPVVVENSAGAGGNIAVDHIAKAAPDGYTIVLANVGALTVDPHLMQARLRPAASDLAPITMAVMFPNVIVRASDGAGEDARRVREAGEGEARDHHLRLLRHRRRRRTSPASCSKMMAQIELVHVPLQGRRAGDARPARRPDRLLSLDAGGGAAARQGRQACARSPPPARSAIRSMPDVPTVAESGYPGYEATNWYAFLAPAKTPRTSSSG